MSAGYSPAPWRVADPADPLYSRMVSSAEGFGDVAACGGLAETAQADARLIAAAPELLAALRRCAQRILADEGINSPIYQQAKAAIDKAEGKA